jgi:hypothetical protein
VFLYLANSGGRVYVPDAVSAGAVDDEPDDVGFYSADGRLLAVFRRQDVSVYSTTDLGLVLDEDKRPGGEPGSFGLSAP